MTDPTTDADLAQLRADVRNCIADAAVAGLIARVDAAEARLQPLQSLAHQAAAWRKRYGLPKATLLDMLADHGDPEWQMKWPEDEPKGGNRDGT